jgi:hypothetical protein
MVNVIVSIGVVAASLGVVSALFALYVWHAAPEEFAMWKRALRARQSDANETHP